MTQVITDFLNSKIDYQSIFVFIGAYLFALWLMFCLWVFVDANKRYKKPLVAVLMSLLVFVFNFPALVFYLIVRPEQDEFSDMATYDSMMQSAGGVQVPVVNFVGENGEVQISLNLQIHPQSQAQADMVIDVGWESNKPSMQVATSNRPQRPTFAEQSKIAAQPQDNSRSRWNTLREKAKNQIKNIHSTVNSTVASSVSGGNNAKDTAEAKKEATPVQSNQVEKKTQKQTRSSES